MTAGKRFLIFRLPLAAYLVLVFTLSSFSVSSPAIQEIPDYYLHTLEYCVMYVLMFRAVHLGWRRLPGKGGFWLPAVLTIAYGISDEFHQSFVPSRNASIADVAADTVGALLGIPTTLLCGRVVSAFRATGTS